MNENRLLEQTRKAACVPKVFSTPWSPSVFSLLFCRLSCVLPTSLTTLLYSLLLHFFARMLAFPPCIVNRNIFILSFPPSLSLPPAPLPIAERHKKPQCLHPFYFLTSMLSTDSRQSEKHTFPESYLVSLKVTLFGNTKYFLVSGNTQMQQNQGFVKLPHTSLRDF